MQRYIALVFLIFLFCLSCGVQSSSGVRSDSSLVCGSFKSDLLAPSISGLSLANSQSDDSEMNELWDSIQKDTHLQVKPVRTKKTKYGRKFYLEIESPPHRSTIPFCSDLSIQVVDLKDNKKKTIGSMPLLSPDFAESYSLIAGFKNDDEKSFKDDLGLLLDGVNPKLTGKKICAKKTGKTYKPFLQLGLGAGLKHYTAWVDQDRNVSSLVENGLSITGTTSAYENSSGDSEPIEFSISGMQDNGFLCNSFAFIRPMDLADPAVSAENQNFVFEPTDPHFQEASAFTYVTLMYDYLVSKGLPDWSEHLIQIVPLDQVDRGPQYFPALTNGQDEVPSIILPNSFPEARLVNLAFNFDAAGHETAHHFIYQYIKNIEADHVENIVLHEALADVFTHAYTCENGIGDNPCDGCLAEYTCDPGTASCFDPDLGQLRNDKCLRSADNDWVYSDNPPPLIKEPHLFSQIFSGFFWDLQKGSDLQTMIELVVGALELHPTGATENVYKAFLENLLLVDQEEFNGALRVDLETYICERKLEVFVSDVVCSE